MKKTIAFILSIMILALLTYCSFAELVIGPQVPKNHKHSFFTRAPFLDQDGYYEQVLPVQKCTNKNYPHNHFRGVSWTKKVYTCIPPCMEKKEVYVHEYGPIQCYTDDKP